MANTKALRKKIEREIAALQEKLRAIEVVESLSDEVGRDDDGPNEATIIGTCEHLLTADWQPVTGLFNAVRLEHPKAHRAAVSTALRRLVQERDVAESRFIGGSKREGFEYRKKVAP